MPTRSTIVALVGHVPLSGVVFETSATLPVVPDIGIVPVASGLGRGVVPPVPAASWTR